MKISDTYTIALNGMRFHAAIGVSEEERFVGEPIEVNLQMKCKTPIAAIDNDDENGVPDYSAIYAIIAETVKQPVKLLERLAVKIVSNIIQTQSIIEITVSVTKKNPPVGADGLDATVTISATK